MVIYLLINWEEGKVRQNTLNNVMYRTSKSSCGLCACRERELTFASKESPFLGVQKPHKYQRHEGPLGNRPCVGANVLSKSVTFKRRNNKRQPSTESEPSAHRLLSTWCRCLPHFKTLRAGPLFCMYVFVSLFLILDISYIKIKYSTNSATLRALLVPCFPQASLVEHWCSIVSLKPFYICAHQTNPILLNNNFRVMRMVGLQK